MPKSSMSTLELPDDLHRRLKEAAAEEGKSPVEWIEGKLSHEHRPVDAERGQEHEPLFKSVAEAVAPYTVDSKTHTPDPKYRSAFGDLVDEKMAKQGFKPPEWPR
jgi:hypothetical protein